MAISLSRVFNPKPGWYKGDFHAHTKRSDGGLSPLELSELAAQLGLDFFAITDHNDLRAFDDFSESITPMLLPGVEVTLHEGHFNVFGMDGNTWVARELLHGLVDLPLAGRNSLSMDHAQLDELLERISGMGLFISINHPRLEPWEWRDLGTRPGIFDGIELLNDPTYPPNRQANPATRRMWSAWLNAGIRPVALGGTDFHSSRPWDDPTRHSLLDLPLTYVYAHNLSCQAVLDGIRLRHAYVTVGPRIEFKARVAGRDYQMGDDLGRIQSGAVVSARVEGCSMPARACLVMNGTIVVERPVDHGGAALEFEVLAEAAQGAWFRFDVLDLDDQTLAISNPIFAGPPRLTKDVTYGDFIP